MSLQLADELNLFGLISTAEVVNVLLIFSLTKGETLDFVDHELGSRRQTVEACQLWSFAD